MSERFGFLEEIWEKGGGNYLIKGSMQLRFAIAAAIINSVEIPNKHILDIGCGITYTPKYLTSFEYYHGIDVAPFVIGKNRERFLDVNDVSFSVDNLEDFKEYDNYNIILCLGYAPFSQHASRPDIRLREVFISRTLPQHKLIILETSNDPDYGVGAEDLEWVKEALVSKSFHVIYDFTFNIKPKKRHGNRRFIVLGK